MLRTFPYMAMTITGVLHAVTGLVMFISYCVIWGITKYPKGLRYDTAMGFSSWIIVVGILGILTGKKRADHRKTQCLKIAYMVTAILSAVFAGLIFFFIVIFGPFNTIGIVDSIASFANFVLAIVSSSICCCCANSTSNPTGVVIFQNQAPSGNYPPGTYPTGNYPPGTYPPPSYPASGQTYPVAQSPPEGVSNPGYQVNPNPANYPTKNEVV